MPPPLKPPLSGGLRPDGTQRKTERIRHTAPSIEIFLAPFPTRSPQGSPKDPQTSEDRTKLYGEAPFPEKPAQPLTSKGSWRSVLRTAYHRQKPSTPQLHLHRLTHCSAPADRRRSDRPPAAGWPVEAQRQTAGILLRPPGNNPAIYAFRPTAAVWLICGMEAEV